MKHLNETLSELRDEELYSSDGTPFLNETELSEKTAEKLFIRVKALKEGKPTPKRRFMFRRPVVILVAALFCILAVGAAKLWPVMFRVDVSDPHLSSFAGFSNWNDEMIEAYLAEGEDIDLKATDEGITIELKRMYFDSNVTVLDFNVVTSAPGANVERSDDDVFSTGFRQWNLLGHYRAMPSMSYRLFSHDDDLTDTVIPYWMVITSDSYEFVGKTGTFRGEIELEGFNYHTADGDMRRNTGCWKFELKLENYEGIGEEFENPVQVDAAQSVKGYRFSESGLAIRIVSPTSVDNVDSVPLYAPVITLRDGSSFKNNLASAGKTVGEWLYTATIDAVVAFPYPVELDEIVKIEYGPIVLYEAKS